MLFFIFQVCISAQESATQVRAVWLTTNYQLDWPSPRQTADKQKEELKSILDKLQALNFNTILFQVRLKGSVLYQSTIEPMCPFIQTRCADGSFFDPLAFAIAECHKRNMECHAWIVTYPIGSQKATPAARIQKIRNLYPDILKAYKGDWYLDPGSPNTNNYLISLVKEIINGYNVDGVHFDYIRYPDENAGFPDKLSYKKYGKGESLASWRRANITNFISEVYNYVKSVKPWIQVSSSPLGIYRSLSGNGNKWSGFESVFQDSYNWLKLGIQDAVYPMLYYQDKNFYPYVDDWLKNANGRLVVPGLGVYKLLPNEQDWELHVLTRQMDYLRDVKAPGEAYFRLGMLLDNIKGIRDELISYYRNPAKLPPMTWLSKEKPESPKNLLIFKSGNDSIQLVWEAPSKDDLTYTVYSFYPGDSIDTNHAENVIAANLHSTQIKIKPEHPDQGKYYLVTASNRFHNESESKEIAFFIFSNQISK